MESPTRTLRTDISELEFAFESYDHVFEHYLDTQTGQILMVPGAAYSGDDDDDMDRALEFIESEPDRFLPLESETDLRPSIQDARDCSKNSEIELSRFRCRHMLRPQSSGRCATMLRAVEL